MSLRLRLVLLLLTIYCFGGWVIARWSLSQVQPRYFEAMEDSMVETALLLAGMLEEELPPLTIASTDRLARVITNSAREPYAAKIFSLQRDAFGLRVYVADRQGIVLYDSANRREPDRMGGYSSDFGGRLRCADRNDDRQR